MKTKVFALALALVTLFSGNAMAQKCDKGSCDKAAAAAKAPGANDKMYRPRNMTDYAFEGILLTVDQQDKINAINAEMKARIEQAKQQRKDCKKDCKKACKGKLGDRRGQGRKDYISKVKEVLTPDQYVVFLENIATMPQKPFGNHGPKRFDGKCGSKAAPGKMAR